MRLTLRTMLAYMDDILEPGDAQEIGQKIEESEFAGKLAHRIRDCIRRGRPAAAGGEEAKGLDPNTVAEYLDNTMPPDRVADFEKVCLESDAHLAEVASCHQVLTLVLGEPAEVDPASRQRMYELPVTKQLVAKVDEPPHSPAVEGNGHPAAAATPRHKSELPDYLRSVRRSRQRLLRYLIAGVVLVAAIVTGLVALGPDSRLRNMIGLAPRTAGPTADPSEASVPVSSAAATVPDGAAAAATASAVAGAAAVVESAIEGVVETDDAPPDPGEAMATDTAESPPSVAAELPADTAETPPAENPTGAAMVASRPAPAGTLPAAVDVAAPAEADAASALPPEPVGQLLDPVQVLLKGDEAANWQRVPGEVLITSAERLLSLPTYRPTVQVGSGFQVQLIDNTRVRLLPRDAEGTPGIAVEYGRLVIQPAGEKPATGPIRIQAGQAVGTLQFVDRQSTAAVEVSRGPADGDPETQPGALIIDLHVTAGKVLWEEGSGDAVTANAPVRLTLSELPAKAVAVTEFPTWIAGSTVTLLDQRASTTLAAELNADKPVVLKLRELSETYRQKEVRWLASRCLAALGDFSPLVTALDDPEQKRSWTDCVDELRWAVGRSPNLAADVRTAMEDAHGEEGAQLYEMLWGYEGKLTPAQASRLVDFLNHGALAFRRLGFWNLRTATGLSLYYQPEDQPIKRAPAVQKWRERVQDGSGKSPSARADDAEAALGNIDLLPGDELPPPQ